MNTANTQYAINRAIQLCEWIAETPHQRGSINGLAAQVRHELSALQPAAAQPPGDDPCPGCVKGGVCRTPTCGRLKLPVDHPFRSGPQAQPQGDARKLARAKELLEIFNDDTLPTVSGSMSSAPARAMEPLTDAMVVAAARVLNARLAEACNINADDQWKIHGDDFKEDARAALQAAHGIPATTPTKTQGGEA